ncbi:MAG: deoxyribonuclease IV [Chthonomonadales bacterium]
MAHESDLIGPHIDPPLSLIPPVLSSLKTKVFQTTLRDVRRLSKDGIPDTDDQAGYIAHNSGLWGIAHASMLISLGSPDPRIRNGSVSALAADANLAAQLGLAGVCFHVGYEKGHDSRQKALDEVIRKLSEVIGKLKPGARVLLENGCEGTELGQTVEEVAYVAKGVGASADQLGFVLDTCHLHVAGFDLAADVAPERLASDLTESGMMQVLTCLHLNDAQAACGSHRDRHAAPGVGTIGDGLLRLLGHSSFSEIPVILEMGMDAYERGRAFLAAG